MNKNTLPKEVTPPAQLEKRRRAKKKIVDAQAPIPARPGVPEMMGSAEVCDVLGVRVQNLQFVRGLPLPVQKIRATRLWLAEEIIAFSKDQRSEHVA